ncbi:dihydrofolate reductase family protein [Schumannella luteola]|uniref:Dihydrofolate reductase n=1 Tax=Schumannella luteola TaxID=472059 RepID=A0A852Y592_9MICO|nr:dihydrofolate reductase family protein [Schumannella luteola]NYG97393.1 dihydrofolate reductase [Schumannella luteola]TPX01642.1 deaminase [Schumannella luteola]
MARISVTESVTLDGVMQGLGRADEDTRGGFDRGGWGDGYQDEASMRFMGEGMAEQGVMLFGRRTYDDVLGHWTAVTESNPFTEHLVNATKYVVSRSSHTQLAYPNSTLLAGDAVETVGRLKGEVDGAISIIGSGELVRALHAAGLVDEFTLQIHPIVLGAGTRLFADGDAERGAVARADLVLERSVVTSTGLIIAQYSVRR